MEMKEYFIPYEQALKLKQLGFPQNDYLSWYGGPNKLTYDQEYNEEDFRDTCCAAPLYQQAFRWFREKYSVIGFVSTGFCPFPDEPKSKSGYRGFIKGIDERSLSSYNVFFRELETYCYKTYEEAELACLNKLIEIVKSNTEEK